MRFYINFSYFKVLLTFKAIATEAQQNTIGDGAVTIRAITVQMFLPLAIIATALAHALVSQHALPAGKEHQQE